MADTFDTWCAKHNRTPEKERGRIMQNLNVISLVLRHHKLPYADLLFDAAESYAALFDQCYSGQECTPNFLHFESKDKNEVSEFLRTKKPAIWRAPL